MATANDTPSTTEVAHVRDLIERHGLIEAARELNTSPQTAAKIAAGIGVSRATVSHVRSQLRQRLVAP